MPARDSDSDFAPDFDPADEPAESTYRLKPLQSAADEDLSREVPAAGNDLRDEKSPPRRRKRKRPRARDSAVPTLSPQRIIGNPRSRPPPEVVSLVSSLWYPLTGN
ncbi:MAG: hypothetical protein IID45_06410, partial [Planctomycetes bacterium]|nr:hypothetical protein [Planctomycetota bacterium]